MRTTCLMILVFASSLLASNVNSQVAKVNLAMKNAYLIEVIREIESQTDYLFVYDKNQIDLTRRVDLVAENKTVAVILNSVFSNTNVVYAMEGNNIMLMQKSEAQQPQQNAVSGKVTDSSGSPLPGVSVVVKGTTNGTITDTNGNYSLSNVPENAILSFSFVGMKTLEVATAGKSTINVSLEVEAYGIDEVVAVGYGVQKKVNLSGAVESVDFSKLSDQPASNSVNALIGKVPGLTLLQNSGRPGADVASVNIRGIGSINAQTNPLVIIDGIEASLSQFAQLNPNEIDNVSILKDASSAAIYGSKASNGVILVTTKSGEDGVTKVFFDAYMGMQNATVLPEVLNASDYATVANEARVNGGLPIFFSPQTIAKIQNDDPTDGLTNTNWYDLIYGSSPVQNYSLTVKGGNKKLNSLASLSYFDQDGIFLNTSYNRLNFRSKTNYTVNDFIKMSLNINFMEGNSHRGFNNPIAEGLLRAVTPAPVYYNNGSPFYAFNDSEVPGFRLATNPVWDAQNGYRNDKDRVLGGAYTVELSWKDILFTGLVSKKFSSSMGVRWIPTWKSTNDNGLTVLQNTISKLTNISSDRADTQIDAYLTYNKQIKKHNIKALFGYSYLENNYSGFTGLGINFPSNSVQVLDAANAAGQVLTGNKWDVTMLSGFNRLNYNFNDKYLFEANFRYDGSSKFAEGNKFSFFPSFSGAWRVSEERFMKNISFIDNLKLRASWGKLGNSQIPSNYAYAATYSLGSGYLVNGVVQNGAAITAMSNEKISWEVTSTTNVGLNATLFKGLEATFDYFVRNTENMLIKLPVPLTLGGLNAPYQNLGKIQNKGWEFSLNYEKNKGDFRYGYNFNISQVKNEVIDINGQEIISNDQRIFEGDPLSSWYGYVCDGIFQTVEEVTNAPFQNTKTSAGDLKYRDISGPDGTPDNIIDSYDRTVIGNGFPELSYGFGGNLGYKDFDFSFFFQGVGNVDVYNVGGGNKTSEADVMWLAEWINRWTPDKPSTKYPRVVDGDGPQNQRFSSYWLEDGSYLRLQNITLGYTLPMNLVNKFKIEKARIYFGGENLLTFTKVKNYDPSRFSDRNQSFEYPLTKTYQLGINLVF